MLDAGPKSPFIPECSPIPLRHDIALYSSSEVAGPIPDINIGSQQMSITLNPVEPDIASEITAREARDLEETERIHEREPKVVSTLEHLKQPETDQHAIESPLAGHNTKLGEATMDASSPIISLVREAAELAPYAELRQAASLALTIFETIQVYELIDL